MKERSGTLRSLEVFTVIAALLALLIASGCTYKDRVAPINLPDSSTGVVVGDGLKIAAHAFTDPDEAEKAFGFDAHKAGLLPVQITFQNDGSEEAMIMPDQTFLIDQNNRAWPILSLERTYDRIKRHVDIGETVKGAGKPALLLGAAGAIAGLAVGIVSGHDMGEAVGKGAALGAASGALIGGTKSYMEGGEKIREDLYNMNMKNQAVLPNEIAYGYLFFPATPGEEAVGAEELRLSITWGNAREIVKLNLRNQ